jgi:hypothetical protein
MNKLNRMLIGSPSEFAAMFGEVGSDAPTGARADTARSEQDQGIESLKRARQRGVTPIEKSEVPRSDAVCARARS